MRELVLQSCRLNPAVRAKAIDIATGFDSSGPVDAARQIEEFIRNAYVFIDEPEELLVDPTVQLQEFDTRGVIHGDCDDAAMLAACFLYMIGLETRLKAVERAPDGSYMHVFAEYRLRDLNRWVPVDPTFEGLLVYAPGDFIVEYI